MKLFSRDQLFTIPWTVAYHTPLSMGFSRQKYWNGLPFPPPEDLPKPRIEPMSLDSPALADRFFTTEPPGKISFKYSPENVSKVKLTTQLSK